jgi:iron complex transport system permease protein
VSLIASPQQRRRDEHPGSTTLPTLRMFAEDADDVCELHTTHLRVIHVVAGIAFLLVAVVAALLVGPADLAPHAVFNEIGSHLPFLGLHSHLDVSDRAVIWQIRMPRIVLGLLVGAMLAVSGASYQGVFHNPLADPYLLGVAAGAGLGATIAIVAVPQIVGWPVSPLPLAAFAGAVMAVAATVALGRTGGARNTSALILAGVAVGSFFTAAQTFLQQRNTPVLQAVYSWILGGLSTAGWSEVWLILPYVVVALALLLFCAGRLDVLSVGDDEASTLGVRANRVRMVVMLAATLGTAAAVAVSGLIGFIGIIVPHTIRLVLGPSYRRIVPMSMIFGGGFLVAADLIARTILSPAEIPIGVVTAFLGAPFFLIVLRQARRFD